MSWIAVGAMALGAGMNKLKNDRAKALENSDRQLASETQRYSPWTGLQAQPIRNAGSTTGEVLGGTLGGLATAQSLGLGAFGKKPTEDTSWWEALKKKDKPVAMNEEASVYDLFSRA